MVKRKWVVWLMTLVLSVALIAVQNTTVIDKSNVTALNNGYSALTYVTEGKKGYLAGDIWSGRMALSSLRGLRVRGLNAVFVESMDAKTAHQIQMINGFFTGFTLYYPAQLKGIGGKPDEDEARERASVASRLKGIRAVPFDSMGDTEGDNLEIVPLEGSFAAVFYNGQFVAYEFCPALGANGARNNVLLPKTHYWSGKWYSLLETVERYDIVATAYYRPLGDRAEEKLYLVGGEETGYNVYSAKEWFVSYNYLTFKFLYG